MVSENFLGIKEDIVPEDSKISCPVDINFTSPQYKNYRTAIIMQFLVDFIQLFNFSIFELES